MPVLVTGASGFVGYHVALALRAAGEEVTCLVRRTSSRARLEGTGVRFAEGDVTDYPSVAAAVRGHSTVYHVAGRVYAIPRSRLFAVNEEGTRNVARACAEQSNPPVLVAVSSLAAAGPSSDGRPRSEAEPSSPVSWYGKSKRAGELAAEAFAAQAPITIVRPPIVFGEADANMLLMFRAIRRSRVHIVPGLRRWRYSLIHAGDLARGMILAARRGRRLPGASRAAEAAAGEGYYFLASDECPTYADLGRMVRAAVGRPRALVIRTPMVVTWLLALAAEAVGRVTGRPIIFNLDKAREAAAGAWTCACRKAKEELGFVAAAPLAEQIRQTADWYRREGWLK